MGKPQSNFQHSTIFGVPLIAGNRGTQESAILYLEQKEK